MPEPMPRKIAAPNAFGRDGVAAQHSAVEHVEQARRDDEEQRTDLRHRGNGQRVDAPPDAANERRVDREGHDRAEQQDDRHDRRGPEFSVNTPDATRAPANPTTSATIDRRDGASPTSSTPARATPIGSSPTTIEPIVAEPRSTPMPMNTAIRPMPNIPMTISWRTCSLARRQPSPGDDQQHECGEHEANQVGRGRAEALARQLVGRQAPAEEDDDRQQRGAHCEGRWLVLRLCGGGGRRFADRHDRTPYSLPVVDRRPAATTRLPSAVACREVWSAKSQELDDQPISNACSGPQHRVSDRYATFCERRQQEAFCS